MPDLDLQYGSVIDNKYRVLEPLGKGGMGEVYKVEHITLSKEMALKLLPSDNFSDDMWRRFKKEVHAASTMDHANLVKVFDFGLLPDKTPFYTMELVKGISLSHLLKEKGPLSADKALAVFIPVCFALQYVHEHQIVHRDIKPGNIMINESSGGRVLEIKVLDFGIAKKVGQDRTETNSLTKPGEIVGSPFYMSPEQSEGKPVDPRSDIYSLGCSLFHALTGTPPYKAKNAVSLAMMHNTSSIPSILAINSSLPEDLDYIVSTMLAKEPGDRYQTMKEVVLDLIAVKGGNRPPSLKNHNSMRRSLQIRQTRNQPSYQTVEADADENYHSGSFTLDETLLSKKNIIIASIVVACLTVGTIAAMFIISGNTSGNSSGNTSGNMSGNTAESSSGSGSNSPNSSDENSGSKTNSDNQGDQVNQSSDENSQSGTLKGNKPDEADHNSVEYKLLHPLEGIGGFGGGGDKNGSDDNSENYKTSGDKTRVSENRTQANFYFSKRGYLEGGRPVRVFEFPDDGDLGTIYSPDHARHVSCRGNVTLPPVGTFIFVPSQKFIKTPIFLKRFREDELEEIDFSQVGPVTDEHVRAMEGLSSLVKLDLNDTDVSGNCIDSLNKLKNLRVLRIARTAISGVDMEKLTSLKKLNSLEARMIGGAPILLKALDGSRQIAELKINDAGLKDQDLVHIRNMPNLQTLSIGNNPEITVRGLRYLTGLKYLHNLSIYGIIILPECVDELSKIKALNFVKVSREDCPDQMFRELQKKLPRGCKLVYQ